MTESREGVGVSDPSDVDQAAADEAFDEEVAEGPSRMMARLGAQIRRRRRALGLSMNDLAGQTSLSISFISMVEQGKSDISLGRLTRIMEVLNLLWIDVMEDEPARSPVITRSPVVSNPLGDGTVRLQALAPALRGFPMHNRMSYEPGAVLEAGDHLYPFGETFCLVLEGEVLFDFHEGGLVLLAAGDSVSYSNAEFKQARNPGRTLATVYVETIGSSTTVEDEYRDEIWL